MLGEDIPFQERLSSFYGNSLLQISSEGGNGENPILRAQELEVGNPGNKTSKLSILPNC